MPELPEVETTKRGVEPHILNKTIEHLAIHNANLRWPIPVEMAPLCSGQSVTRVARRAKYIIVELNEYCLLIHLGMSGSLRIIRGSYQRLKHDHVELFFADQTRMVFNDPRRFGCYFILPHAGWREHDLLNGLGPEPFDNTVDGSYFYSTARNKVVAVKNFVMDQRIVVGVGNIYANEALFKAGIHPKRQASKVSRQRYHSLARHIKETLQAAIEMGGTTLRDFVNSDGQPGYFQQTLQVYGRAGQSCRVCHTKLREIRLGQRTTVYCPQCQR